MLLADLLAGLLRPTMCLGCGTTAAWPCCARCLPSDPAGVGPWRLAANPDVALWALGPYREGLRAAVLAGKLHGQPAALTELGRRLGTALTAAGVGADLVTYVAAGRVAGAPRDHAKRVAAGVAGALDLPMVDLLAPAGGPDLGRARGSGRADPMRDARGGGRTDPMRGARGGGWADPMRDARGGGRADPVVPPPPRPPPRGRYLLAGGRILLVDDLATTGGTLAGAAATLYGAGARQVETAVLAVAPTAVQVGTALLSAAWTSTTHDPPSKEALPRPGCPKVSC
jgi:predicted amidophosphoribosyltransferase